MGDRISYLCSIFQSLRRSQNVLSFLNIYIYVSNKDKGEQLGGAARCGVFSWGSGLKKRFKDVKIEFNERLLNVHSQPTLVEMHYSNQIGLGLAGRFSFSARKLLVDW